MGSSYRVKSHMQRRDCRDVRGGGSINGVLNLERAHPQESNGLFNTKPMGGLGFWSDEKFYFQNTVRVNCLLSQERLLMPEKEAGLFRPDTESRKWACGFSNQERKSGTEGGESVVNGSLQLEEPHWDVANGWRREDNLSNGLLSARSRRTEKRKGWMNRHNRFLSPESLHTEMKKEVSGFVNEEILSPQERVNGFFGPERFHREERRGANGLSSPENFHRQERDLETNWFLSRENSYNEKREGAIRLLNRDKCNTGQREGVSGLRNGEGFHRLEERQKDNGFFNQRNSHLQDRESGNGLLSSPKGSHMQVIESGDLPEGSLLQERLNREEPGYNHVPFIWESSPGKPRRSNELVKRDNCRLGLQLPPKLQAPLSSKSLQVSPFTQDPGATESRSQKLIKLCSKLMCKSPLWAPRHTLFQRSFGHVYDKEEGDLRVQSFSANYNFSEDPCQLFDGKGGKGLVIIEGRAFFWPPSPPSSDSDEEDEFARGGLVKLNSWRTISFKETSNDCVRLELDVLPAPLLDVDEESIASSLWQPILYREEERQYDIEEQAGQQAFPSTSTMESSWCLDLSPDGDDGGAENVHKEARSRILIKKGAVMKSITSLVCKLKRRKTHAIQTEMWSPTLATYLYDTKKKEKHRTMEEGDDGFIANYEMEDTQPYSSSPYFSDGDVCDESSMGCSLGHSRGSEQFSVSPITTPHHHCHHHDISSCQVSPWPPFMDSPSSARKQLVPCKSFCKAKKNFRGLVATIKLIFLKREARVTRVKSLH